MARVEVTSDSLVKVFRSLSQKRCSGVLCITSEGSEVHITLQQGRIIGAKNAKDDTAAHIIQRLLNAGCIDIEVLEELTAAELSLLQLYDWLIERGYVTAEQFMRARRGYELDLLHSLREFESGTADIKQQLPDEDEEHSLSVYPAQLLLDIEDLKESEGRFSELFAQAESKPIQVRRIGEPYDGLSDEELVLLEVVEEGVSPKQMIEASMLSRYHLIESVLSLYDQSLIAIVDPEQAPPAAAAEENSLEASAALASEMSLEGASSAISEMSLEDASSPISEMSLEGSSSPIGEMSLEGSSSPVSEMSLEDSSSSLSSMSFEGAGADGGESFLEEFEDEMPAAAGLQNYGADTAMAGFDSEESDGLEEMEFSEVGGMPEAPKMLGIGSQEELAREAAKYLESFAGADISDESETGLSGLNNSLSNADGAAEFEGGASAAYYGGIKGSIRSFNYYLSDPEVEKNLIMALTLAFLLVFAVVGPEFIENWFTGLRKFTS